MFRIRLYFVEDFDVFSMEKGYYDELLNCIIYSYVNGVPFPTSAILDDLRSLLLLANYVLFLTTVP